MTEIARSDGRYAEEAYLLIRDGLEYAAQSIHGPMTPQQQVVAEYMVASRIDYETLVEQYNSKELPKHVARAIDKAGGPEKVNRNVRGDALCWALRDLCLRRWGQLARTVLGRWNIRTTDDFGRIVFSLVEHGLMQKESRDTLDDFHNVYDFAEAFDQQESFFGDA